MSFLPIVAVGLQVASVVAQSSAMKAQGEAQNQAAIANARAQEQAAKAARQKGAFEAGLLRERGQGTLSTQRARYGMSGVAMSGSALDVALATAKDVEMDALATKYNSEVGARQSETQADIYRWQGSTAKQMADYSANMTLLTGLTSIGINAFTGGMFAPASKGGLSGFGVTASGSGSGNTSTAGFGSYKIPGWSK
jgi:hypothetical protein